MSNLQAKLLVIHIYIHVRFTHFSTKLLILFFTFWSTCVLWKICHHRAVQCIIMVRVAISKSLCFSLLHPDFNKKRRSSFHLSSHFPSASFSVSPFPSHIFISSCLFIPDISIALLRPHRLRGELEHMCATRCCV